MSTESKIVRPILVPHAKFRWDNVRKQHQIVYPEGVLVLNESGASIVAKCDGRTTTQLIADLEQAVSNENLASDIETFLERLVQKGLLCDAIQ